MDHKSCTNGHSDQGRPGTDLRNATHDGERTGLTCQVSSHRTVEPGVPPSETWSNPLVMLAQPVSKEGHSEILIEVKCLWSLAGEALQA